MEVLFSELVQGKRHALAKSITLIESSLREHQLKSVQLLTEVAKYRKQTNLETKTFRIGFSGSPGAGKSTLIEALGIRLADMGHRVAVLAVDPSSIRTGGSIMGDKTRMLRLSTHPYAYVRPSSTRGALGGVTRNTFETIELCETAGFDVILIETVGVGQSEHTVATMVDMFTLLVPPASGDELQGIKRGIIELVDLVLITKADGDLERAARYAQIEYASALKFIPSRQPSWKPKVMSVSSIKNQGISDAWQTMLDYKSAMMESRNWIENRSKQRKEVLWSMITDGFMRSLSQSKILQEERQLVEQEIMEGSICLRDASLRFLQKLGSKEKFL